MIKHRNLASFSLLFVWSWADCLIRSFGRLIDWLQYWPSHRVVMWLIDWLDWLIELSIAWIGRLIDWLIDFWLGGGYTYNELFLPFYFCFLSRKSIVPHSVIVQRDTVHRSQSQNDCSLPFSSSSHSPHQSHESPPSRVQNHHKLIPSSAPPSLMMQPPPSMMHFYGGNGVPLFTPPLIGDYPVLPGDSAFAYSPQAMMMMMQQQQETRDAFQYQMYAQHERLREEAAAAVAMRLPTYPSPRDYFSSADGSSSSRSVIVPTAEAQDLRVNRTAHQRFPSYGSGRDGSYWLIDHLIDWSIDRLSVRSIDWLLDWLIVSCQLSRIVLASPARSRNIHFFFYEALYDTTIYVFLLLVVFFCYGFFLQLEEMCIL